MTDVPLAPPVRPLSASRPVQISAGVYVPVAFASLYNGPTVRQMRSGSAAAAAVGVKGKAAKRRGKGKAAAGAGGDRRPGSVSGGPGGVTNHHAVLVVPPVDPFNLTDDAFPALDGKDGHGGKEGAPAAGTAWTKPPSMGVVEKKKKKKKLGRPEGVGVGAAASPGGRTRAPSVAGYQTAFTSYTMDQMLGAARSVLDGIAKGKEANVLAGSPVTIILGEEPVLHLELDRPVPQPKTTEEQCRRRSSIGTAESRRRHSRRSRSSVADESGAQAAADREPAQGANVIVVQGVQSEFKRSKPKAAPKGPTLRANAEPAAPKAAGGSWAAVAAKTPATPATPTTPSGRPPKGPTSPQ